MMGGKNTWGVKTRKGEHAANSIKQNQISVLNNVLIFIKHPINFVQDILVKLGVVFTFVYQ